MATSEKPAVKKMITPVFRLSFPNLFAAKAIEGDSNSKPKFGCAAVWTPSKFTEKEKVLWKAIMGELNAAALERFKKPWKELPDNIRRGLRDGAAKDGLEGYGPGTRFANLTSNSRPGVVSMKRDEDTGEFVKIGPEHGNADLIYPGCYCRATVNVYSYDKNKGKGVAIGLRHVQKVKDGERLDSRSNADDDFDEDVDSAWLDGADDSSGDDEDFG